MPVQDLDYLRQEAFKQLKPSCTHLLGLSSAPLTPSSAPALIAALEGAQAALLSVPSPSSTLTLALIQYVFFPFASLLRQHAPTDLPDRVAQAVLECLGFLAGHWVAQGMRPGEWEQLWILGAMTLLGGLDESGKGKKRELSEETKLAAVQLLLALSAAVPPAHPTPAHISALRSPRTMPILGSIVSGLLTLAQSERLLSLRLVALALLQTLLETYLFDAPDTVALVLPGTVSGMCRVMLGGKAARERGDVIQAALRVFAEAVRVACSDAGCVDLLPRKISRLDEIADWVNPDTLEAVPPPSVDDTEPLISSGFAPAGFGTAAASSSSTPSASGPPPPGQPPGRTPSWLTATSHQMRLALASLTPLLQHTSPVSRGALVELAATLMSSCLTTLESSLPILLSHLLVLSLDADSGVRARARATLADALRDPRRAEKLVPLLRQGAEDSLRALPRLIRSQDDTRVAEACDRITAAAELHSLAAQAGTSGVLTGLGGLLGPQGGVEKWAWSFLDCLEFLPPPTAASPSAARALAWSEHFNLLPSSGEGDTVSPGDAPFPHLPLRHLASSDKLVRMFRALARAGGEDALYAVEHFWGLASARARASHGPSALWVAEVVLEGVAQDPHARGAVERMAGIMARGVVRLCERVEDDDGEGVEETAQPQTDPADDALLPTEFRRGPHQLTTLLDLQRGGGDGKPRRPTAASRAHERLAHLTLLTCVSLQTVACTSSLLPSSFRPHLLSTLYFLLRHLGSPSATIHAFAEPALLRVSYHAGYASASNAVLANADYLLNSVGQRLTPAQLDPAAPRVLVAMVRLVGPEIVPRLHDVVDEVFDALDDFHKYLELCEGLLAVLDGIMKVMASDPALEEIALLRPPGEARTQASAEHPDPARDMERLVEWFEHRHDPLPGEAVDEDEEIVPTPHEPWGAKKGDAEAEEEVPPHNITDAEPTPPTRSQLICTLILNKALFFLTHPSPFLRARVLSLVASGVPVLARAGRESDLLPTIHQAWPYVLNRLTNKDEPYVSIEAAGLVETLARETGDFMALRILDDAWPRFKTLLGRQREADRRSALPVFDRHSVSNRLHAAMLRTMTSVVRDVPVRDVLLWELALEFRRFLGGDVEEGLRAEAKKLFEALEKRNEDLVWVVVEGTEGTLGGDAEWLRDRGRRLEDRRGTPGRV